MPMDFSQPVSYSFLTGRRIFPSVSENIFNSAFTLYPLPFTSHSSFLVPNHQSGTVQHKILEGEE